MPGKALIPVKFQVSAKAKTELIVICIIAAVLFRVLMVPPVTGVADNGDFDRIMNSVGLSHIPDDYDEKYFGYVNREYKITGGRLFDGGYISSEIPVVMLAVAVSGIVTGSEIFDIRFLSAIYSIVFIIGIYLILRSAGRISVAAFIPLGVMLILVFTDIGYIAYFNSFYGEAVTVSFFILLAGAVLCIISSSLLNEKPKTCHLAAFYTAAAFFMTAKVQNIPAGFIILLFGLCFLRLRRDKAWKRAIAAASVIILGFSILSFATVSRDIKICNKYQAVFYGILKDSPDVVTDLEKLGLNPDYQVLAGTHYFMEEYPTDIRNNEFKNYIYENVSYLKVAGFYLCHPDRLIDKLQVAAANAFKMKTGLGNFEKEAGHGYKAVADYLDAWSDFRENFLPRDFVFIALFFSLIMLLLCISYIKLAGKGANGENKHGESKNGENRIGLLVLIEFLAAVSLIGASQMVLPLLGDGEADLGKHLFLFNFAFDILFIALAVFTVAGIAKAAGYLKLCYNNRRHFQ